MKLGMIVLQVNAHRLIDRVEFRIWRHTCKRLCIIRLYGAI